MSNYGEEYGDSCKYIKLTDLQKAVRKISREASKESRLALKAKTQLESEWHSAKSQGCRFAIEALKRLAAMAL